MKLNKITYMLIFASALVFALSLTTACNTGTSDPTNPPSKPPKDPVLVEKIINGNFLDGFTDPWSVWNGEGGASTQEVSNGELVVTVTNAGTVAYSVQISQAGLSMPDGDYSVSFRAKSAIKRPIRVQFGAALNSDPWFIDFTPVHAFNLTTEWQIFTFKFTKNNAEQSFGKMVFELGKVTGEGTLTTDVSIDDVSLIYFDTGDNPGTPEIPGDILYPATNADTWTPGDGWTLAWQDEFTSTFDTNIWTRQTMMNPHNNELQQYPGGTNTDNAWVKDGYMVLKAAMNGTTHGKNKYTSARVISNPGGQNGTSTADGKTFLYGKIAARIQLPYGKGIWPAFWMLGDNINETGGSTTWPECGEIDILETGAKEDPNYGQGTTHGTLHHDPTVENITGDYNNEFLPSAKYTLPEDKIFAENFHVFELEWNEKKMIWRVDGIKIGEQSISEAGRSEFHLPFYVIFNIAVGGNFTATPDSSTHFPQFMYIDWIRHYTK